MNDFDERYAAIRRNMADYSGNTSGPAGIHFVYAFVDLSNRKIHLGRTSAADSVFSIYGAFRRKGNTKKLPVALRGMEKGDQLKLFIKADPDGEVRRRVLRPTRLWWHR
jgi:hypothetical protein